MANEAQGYIEKISTRDWQDLTFYSIKLEDDRNYYNMGTNKPGAVAGDQVKFRWDNDKKGYPAITKAGVQKVVDPDVEGDVDSRLHKAVTALASPKPAPRAASQKDTYWADKEAYQKEVVEPRITYQASRAHAVQLVCAALQHEAISFGNAAKGKRLDIMMGMVNEVTDQFVLDAINAPQKCAELVKEAAATAAATDMAGADYDE